MVAVAFGRAARNLVLGRSIGEFRTDQQAGNQLVVHAHGSAPNIGAVTGDGQSCEKILIRLPGIAQLIAIGVGKLGVKRASLAELVVEAAPDGPAAVPGVVVVGQLFEITESSTITAVTGGET